MKTCPDCAEHIQEAARKCRFCGFRFDGAAVASDLDAEPAGVAAPAPGSEPDIAPPPAGYVALAAGGAGVFVGGVSGSLAMAMARAQLPLALAWTNVVGLVGGGILLAIGWLVVATHGGGGFGGLVGGLALAAGEVGAVMIGGADANAPMTGLLAAAGMACCLFLHLGTLERSGFDGPRLAALLGCVGIGGELFSFAKRWDLAPWIWQTMTWCGFGGIVLFGLSLSVTAARRARERLLH